ncbi:rRNA methyltransferase [Clostridium estertheticum]|uniref:rRNA methyltransferase n=1 Tax=Clostridium estertheticum TaxID=238834 RepID=UPI001C0B7A5C|nr:rRNA methyltransferase [Clostridium estertheticum]MBU3216680.1 rRNA methyltransferase [Clostridium estertheticum]WAG54364.1 rRNA methyltransferase [Clostridium estertheticum]
MYKSIYFKPKYKLGLYESFINDFVINFELLKIKNKNKVYFFENEDMIVKIEPKIAEILLYNIENKEAVKKVKNYFK